ncbi:MAG TPA: DUF2723 domain-containing protein [Sulfurihydrogenibium azorense]|uniref:DUF2723 domain-containing protein n=1 Tax=Sulfurihydrogenibium azorense TaxID=309806 RepID=A0A832DQV3_9AQUI|nr:DUF2723 domain-containing protein [Sulfurihydrogenibium azorense]
MVSGIKKYKFEFFLFSFIFFVYLLTLYGIGGRVNFGDSAKWQFIFDTNFITHPTGYPLYMFLSKLFNYLFLYIHPQAVRINLMSLFFGILALIFMYKIVFLFTRNKLISSFPVFVLAFMYSFWSQSTEAEVYTLNAFFVTFVLYNFLKFNETKNYKFLYVGILSYAISFGNHLSMIFLFPVLIYILFITDKNIFKNLKIWLFSLFSIILGASQYLYIWGRFENYYKSALDYLWGEGEVFSSIENSKNVYEAFFRYITGGQFKQEFFSGFKQNITFLPSILGKEFFLSTENIFGYSITAFLIITIILMLILFPFLLKKHFEKLAIFYIMIFGYSFFTLGYPIEDINVYFIPIYIALLILFSLSLFYLYQNKKYMLSSLLFFPLFTLSLYSLSHIPDMRKYDNSLIDKLKFILDGLYDKNINVLSPIRGLASSYNYYLAMLLEYNNQTKEVFKMKAIDLYTIKTQKPKEFYVFNWTLQSFKKKDFLKDYVLLPYKTYPPLNEVLDRYSKEGYTVILFVVGDGYDAIMKDIKAYTKLKMLGASFKDFCYGSSYILIIRNGKILNELSNVKDSVAFSVAFLKDRKYWTTDYKNNGIIITVSSAGFGKNCKKPSDKERWGITFFNNGLSIQDKPYYLNLNGLHVAVLDASLSPILYNVYNDNYSFRDIYLAKLKDERVSKANKN